MSANPGPASWPDGGLVAAVVQDAADGRVLMVGWMDEEAYHASRATGEVHFHSRSRDRLWRKGETSGNVLRIRSLRWDCDADVVLVQADPAGPTCHRGTGSCFDAEGEPAESRTQGFAWLETLWAVIASRAADRPEGSYTAGLIAGGVDATARKVAEEATEVVLAAKDHAAAEKSGEPRGDSQSAAAVAAETADLLFHTLVLLAERRVAPAAVVDVLRARHAG